MRKLRRVIGTSAVLLAWLATGAAQALTVEERVAILWDRADRQIDAGKPEDAIASGRKAVRIAPNSADAWSLLAYAYCFDGSTPLERTETTARHALKLDPGCAKAHHTLGLVLRSRPDTPAETAVAEFREAIRLDPNLSRAHSMLGSLLAGLGQSEEAIAEMRESVRLEPSNPNWRINLSWALAENGQVEEAFEQSDETLSLPQTEWLEAVVHNNVACFYAWSGQKARALQEARKALDLQPDSPDINDTLGAIVLLFGDPKEAEGYLRKAAAAGAPLTGSHEALAYCLALQGRDQEARAELSKVSRELVEQGVVIDALYFAGRAYDSLGEPRIAKRIFRRAVERWPEHPWSNEMREYLIQHQAE
jgi:Flp pilus assembly protein TadD